MYGSSSTLMYNINKKPNTLKYMKKNPTTTPSTTQPSNSMTTNKSGIAVDATTKNQNVATGKANSKNSRDTQVSSDNASQQRLQQLPI